MPRQYILPRNQSGIQFGDGGAQLATCEFGTKSGGSSEKSSLRSVHDRGNGQGQPNAGGAPRQPVSKNIAKMCGFSNIRAPEIRALILLLKLKIRVDSSYMNSGNLNPGDWSTDRKKDPRMHQKSNHMGVHYSCALIAAAGYQNAVQSLPGIGSDGLITCEYHRAAPSQDVLYCKYARASRGPGPGLFVSGWATVPSDVQYCPPRGDFEDSVNVLEYRFPQRWAGIVAEVPRNTRESIQSVQTIPLDAPTPSMSQKGADMTGMSIAAMSRPNVTPEYTFAPADLTTAQERCGA
ncbi:hypothetical protein B0H19DRAFT_1064634 [Mycena capillaripes]|nr:hypothetical protein B0H19DRAFT_1064634 [Mycena capillaripes]